MPGEAPACPPLALRPAQASATVGLSPRAFWAIVQRGDGPPAVCLGESTYTAKGKRHTRRLLVFPVDSLRAWLASKAQAPATAAPVVEAKP